jgi:hypothetical protein
LAHPSDSLQANKNAPYGNATTNPAGDVARLMPRSLPSDHPLNSSGTNIQILDPVPNGYDAIYGTYTAVRTAIQSLHAEHGGKVDLFIHLGRGPWEFVSCERFAFSQSMTCSWLSEPEAKEGYYTYRHNDGKTAEESGGDVWREKGVPMGLNSEVDVNHVVALANTALEQAAGGGEGKTLEVRSHLEAGPAGCGYAFYESLANCWVAARKRDVLFCHVPRHTDQENLEKARDAVLAVIGASVAALMKRESEPAGDWKIAFGEQR